ncbi:MAG TPA: DNA polymerase III subunit gamma/tau [Burkholderiales bacterium]|nr:DNA polymerase III subunit gamma/tau [Burkholderiales bacterium]
MTPERPTDSGQPLRTGSGQALARKWRPRTFDELVGQEHVVRALTNALRQNRLHHAWLLTGTRGVGKTTLARIMAKALNCETGVTPAPCGVCPACTEIDGGRFVDLLELDAASNTQVDNMRELLENALYAPASGRFKVYIIDEVHMLSRSAFSAMLKTLEEPPEHVKFILATTEAQKVPVTVLSRCLQFNLKLIPAPEIQSRLAQILAAEDVTFEAAALKVIARAAQGSLRDALSLLDQAIAHGAGRVDEKSVRAMLGTVDQSYLFSILDALGRRDGARVLAIADEMQARSFDFEFALQELATVLHRIALLQTLPDALAADDIDREPLISLAAALAPEDVQLYYQIALQGRSDLPLAPDDYAGFTMPLLRMLAFAPEGPEPWSPPVGESNAVPGTGSSPRAGPASKTSLVSAPSDRQRSGPQPNDWRGLVASLKLGGMACMLAEHSELVGCDAEQLELMVPEAHRHLLEKPYRDKLQAALEAHYGRKLRLTFTLGANSGNTPAGQQDQERQALQRLAIEAIERDPFVRELVENFGARVADDSIHPVESSPSRQSGG